MMKYLKLYAQFRDARKAIAQEYSIGKILGVLLSRKAVGPILILIGQILREFFGVEVDEAALMSTTDAIVLLTSIGIQAHGAIMAIVSVVKDIVNKVKAAREEAPVK
jgi:uncharacterized membrane protein